MRRALRILVLALVTAAIGGGSAALWHTRPQRSSVMTDADTIRNPVGAIPERGIAWQPPAPMPIAAPMPGAFGATITPDGGTAYFARRSERGDSDILVSTRSGDGWTMPVVTAFSSAADDIDPAVAPDGSVHFASNRAGGLGGYDLWVARPTDHGGWSEPEHLGATVNSPWHEAGPALEPADEGGALLFSSNRPRPGEATAGADAWASELQEELAERDHDLYRAPRVVADLDGPGHGAADRDERDIGRSAFDVPQALVELNTTAQELAPEVSAAGDFLYFASDRPGGRGDLDLYRAWRRDGADRTPMALGPDVNTPGRETDPALALDGFQLVFSSDRASAGRGATASGTSQVDGTALFVTTAREVFRHTDVHRARIDWLAILPWVVWGLMLGLLAALLWGLLRALRSEGFSKLGLMARCLLASALVHMLVLLLMTFWGVGSSVADWAREGRGTRVVIASPSVGSGLAEQVRGALTELAIAIEAADAAQQEAAVAEPLLLTATAFIPVERAAVPEMNEPLLEDPSEAASEAEAVPAEVAAAAPVEVAAAAPATVDAPAAPTPTSVAEAAPRAEAHAATAHRSDAPPLAVTAEAAVALEAAPASVERPQATFVDPIDGAERAADATVETELAAASPQAVAPSDAPSSPQLPAVETIATERRAEAQQVVTATAEPTAQRFEPATLASASATADAAADFTPAPTATSTSTVVLTTLEVPADVSTAADAESSHMGSPPPPPATQTVPDDLALAALPTPATAEAPATERGPRIEATAADAPARADAAPMSVAAADADTDVAEPLPASRIAPSAPLALAAAVEASPTDTPASAASAVEVAPSAASADLSPLTLALPQDLNGGVPTEEEREDELLVAAAPSRRAIDRSDTLPSSRESTARPATLSSPTAASSADAAPPVQLAEVAEAVESAGPALDAELPTLELALAGADAPSLPPLEENSSIANAYAVADETLELEADERPAATSRTALPPAAAESQSAAVALALDEPDDAPDTTTLVRADARDDADELPAVTLPAMALATLPDEALAIDLALDLPTEVAAPPNPYRQRAPEQREALVERLGGSAETEQAVTLALDWLARHQSMDGRWDSDGFDFECGACNSAARVDVDIALTGLSMLCFLATDNTHLKPGPYQENIAAALEFLLERQRPGGDLVGRETLYSHGIATIALAEAYGMTGDPRLKEPIERAIAFIIASRNLRVGGWRYAPGQVGDTSVLGWQIMAMKSARRAGIEVPELGFETARRWLHLVASPSNPGQYAYQPNHSPTPAMTAESMFVNQLLGAAPHEPRQDASASWVAEHLPEWGEDANTYYWYYGTLALFQHQGEHWESWNERVKDELVAAQRQDGKLAGSWDPSDQWSRVGGRVYQTAICTLTLQVYYRYLPLYVE